MYHKQSARLMRQQWIKAQHLAEELYAMFQSTVPLSHEAPVTIRSPKPPADENEQAEPPPPLTLSGGNFAIKIERRDGGTTYIKEDGTIERRGAGGQQQEDEEEEDDGAGTILGKVVSKASGQNYTVDLYEDDLVTASQQVTVRHLNINADEEIPAGTWIDVNKLGESYYTTDPPVWIEEA